MKNAIIRTLPEAPKDSKLYGRNNAQWVEIDLSGIGTGDMNKAIYDPNLIESDVYNRSNHTGTQLSSTISDFATTVTNTYAVQQNTAKVSFPEAPLNGSAYARQNGTWQVTEAFVDAPADQNQYVRKNNSWQVLQEQDLSDYITEAPIDGGQYLRYNGTWVKNSYQVLDLSGTIDKPDSESMSDFNTRLASEYPRGLNLNGYTITINLLAGTHLGSLNIPNWFNGSVLIKGNITTWNLAQLSNGASTTHVYLKDITINTLSSGFYILGDGTKNSVSCTGCRLNSPDADSNSLFFMLDGTTNVSIYNCLISMPAGYFVQARDRVSNLSGVRDAHIVTIQNSPGTSGDYTTSGESISYMRGLNSPAPIISDVHDDSIIFRNDNGLKERASYGTFDVASDDFLNQAGYFPITCERLATGAYRITHNLNTQNYTLSVISGNSSDPNKILTSSYNTLGFNNFDVYFQKAGSSVYVDPVTFNVRVSYIE